MGSQFARRYKDSISRAGGSPGIKTGRFVLTQKPNVSQIEGNYNYDTNGLIVVASEEADSSACSASKETLGVVPLVTPRHLVQTIARC